MSTTSRPIQRYLLDRRPNRMEGLLFDLPLCLAADRREMRACAEQRRLGLQPPEQRDELLAARGVLPVLGQAGDRPRRALDGGQLLDRKAGFGDLGAELVGMVEEGGGEPVWPVVRVAMLPVR